MAIQPRAYQLEILELAKAENVIAVLPTGSGKTLVAALLLRHRWSSFDRRDSPIVQLSTSVDVANCSNSNNDSNSSSSGRIRCVYAAAFLAPTKVLVYQQAAYLKQFVSENNMSIKVSIFTGDTFNSHGLHIDRWMGQDWHDCLGEDSIMVMTPAIMQDILQRSLLPFAAFDYLVIDEIHRAQKSSPAAIVCKYLKEHSDQHSIRILGLTASPITGKSMTMNAVNKLEETTSCRVVVVENNEELEEFTGRHTDHFVRYEPAVLLDDIEVILTDQYVQTVQQDQFNLREHGMQIVLHACMRMRHAMSLCEIYRTCRTLSKQPHDFDFLMDLNLHPTLHRHSSLAPFIAYEALSTTTYNSMKNLNSHVRQFALVAAEAGSLVAIQAMALTLPHRSGVDQTCLERDSSETSVDMTTMQKRGQIVHSSPFTLEVLYQSEACMCCSTVDIFMALAAMMGPVACRMAADLLIKDNPDEQEDSNDLLVTLARLLRNIAEEPSTDKPLANTAVVRYGTFGFLDGLSLDAVGFMHCSKVVISAAKHLLVAFPQQDISCLSVPLSSILSDKVMKTLTMLYSPPFADESVETVLTGPELAMDVTIVFCNMRIMAIALAAVVATRESLLATIIPETTISRKRKTDVLVGGSWGRKQHQIIESLRSGDLNCVFATNVLEEGLDVQNCQVIINFDLPASMSSFLQRRGRARRNNTHIISLVPNSSVGDDLAKQFEQFGVTEIEIASLVSGRSQYNLPTFSETSRKQMNGIFDDGVVPPASSYEYIVEATGAVVDTTNATKILFQYCGSLNVRKDFYYVPKPIFYMTMSELFDQSGHPFLVYTCSLLLPAPTPSSLRCYVGPMCRSKRAARAVTSFQCVRALHKAKEIDDWLYPGNLGTYLSAILDSSKNPALNADLQSIYRSRHISLGSDVFMNGNRLAWIKTVPDIGCPTPAILANPSTVRDAHSLEDIALNTAPAPVKVAAAITKLFLYKVDAVLVECSSSDFASDSERLSKFSTEVELHLNGLRDTTLAFLCPLPDDILHETFDARIRGKVPARIQVVPVMPFELEVAPEDMIHLQRFHRAVLNFENELVPLLGLSSLDKNEANLESLPWLNLSAYLDQKQFAMESMEFIQQQQSFAQPSTPDCWASSSKGMFYLLMPPLSASCDYTSVYFQQCANEAQMLSYNLTAKYLLKSWDSNPTKASEHYNMEDSRSSIDFESLNGCLIARPGERLAMVVKVSPKLFLPDSSAANTQETCWQLSLLPIHSDISLISFLLATTTEPQVQEAARVPCATNIISSKITNDKSSTHVHRHSELQTFEVRINRFEMCDQKFKVLGKARWLILGLSTPSSIWRIQSYLLAMELRVHLENIAMNSAIEPVLKREFVVSPTKRLLTAMTLRMCNELIDNERLELLGDSVLKLLISVEMFKMYPSKSEGYLTIARSSIISNLNLFKVCVDTELFRYLRAQSVLSRQDQLHYTPPGMSIDSGSDQFSMKFSLRGRRLVGPLAIPNVATTNTSVDNRSENVELPPVHISASVGSPVCVENAAIDKEESATAIRTSILNPNSTKKPKMSTACETEYSLEHTPMPAQEKPTAIKEVIPTEIKRALEHGTPRSAIIQYTQVPVKEKTLSDFIEALIGAAYLDGGLHSAAAFIKLVDAWPVRPPSPPLTTEYSALDSSSSTAISENPEVVVIPMGYPRELADLAVGVEVQLLRHNAPPNQLNRRKHIDVDSSIVALAAAELSKLRELEYVLGYRFRDLQLLHQAMTHCSIQHKANNQRLEYLGDAVLDFVVVDSLFKMFPEAGPGELSTRKSALVNNENLGKIAVCQLSLYKFLSGSESTQLLEDLRAIDQCAIAANDTEGVRSRHSPASLNQSSASKLMEDILSGSGSRKSLPKAVKALADAFEATVGAIYLDSECSLTEIHALVARLDLLSSAAP